MDSSTVLLPLVAVSGSEFVDALTHAGFDVHGRTDETTTLVKAGRAVTVRSTALLMPEELVALLRDAGLAYSDFLDLLSEAPTDPDIRRTGSGATRDMSSAPPR